MQHSEGGPIPDGDTHHICPLCKQPLPVAKLGMTVALERNRMTLPDGSTVKLQPRQAEFLHVMIARARVSPEEMMKALYGSNSPDTPPFARTAVRVVASSLRRKLKPFGYTIAAGLYELQRRETPTGA